MEKLNTNRTVKKLSQMEETVYVYLANVEVGETFLQMAEDEGV